MAIKEVSRERTNRLHIPERLKPHLPKIHWALHVLRNSINDPEFKWVSVQKDEKSTKPFFNIFDQATQDQIDRMRITLKAPRQSRSAIVATALELYDQKPNLNEPDKGLN